MLFYAKCFNISGLVLTLTIGSHDRLISHCIQCPKHHHTMHIGYTAQAILFLTSRYYFHDRLSICLFACYYYTSSIFIKRSEDGSWSTLNPIKF